MNKLINRARLALQGEDGGPQIETIIGISVALIVATALIALGSAMVSWLGGATDKVNGLKQG